MSMLARRLTVHNPAENGNGGNGGETTDVLTSDAAWTWFHDPRATYHSGTHNRTYVTWTASDGIWVGAYDHSTNEWFDFRLTDADQDDHHVAALGVRTDGRILACYSEHNGDLMQRISVDAEDVWDWPLPETLDTAHCTYPNLIYLSSESRWYLFYSTGEGSTDKWRYRTSDDDGDTWSTDTILWEPGSGKIPYMKVASDGVDQIHFGMTDDHPDDADSSIYHLHYDDGTWRDSDGTDIGSPSFDTTDVTQVYDGVAGDPAWIWDVAPGPVMVFATLPSSTDHRYQYAKLNGSWDVNEITGAGKHIYEGTSEPQYSAGVVLDHADTDVVYLAREVVTDRWELEKWTTSDGGTSWSSTAITENSDPAPDKNFRPMVPRGASPFDVIWCRGEYNTYTDFASDLAVEPAVVVDNADQPTVPTLDVTSGLLQWVDASELTGLETGDGVGTWEDESGNGHDKTGTAGSWPIYTEYIFGTLPAVHFRPGDVMETAAGVPVAAASDWTEFIVLIPTAWEGLNPGLWRSDSDSKGDTFFIFNSNTGRPWVRWNGTEILQPSSGWAASLDERIVIALQVEDATSVDFRVNGTLEHSDTHAASNPSMSIYNWFWQNDTGQRVEGYYAERIAYDRLLTSTEVEDVEDYLMEKWSVA